MNEDVKGKSIDLLKHEFSEDLGYNFFTFCLRDFYNLIYIVSYSCATIEGAVTAIYHPDDYRYLSSLALNKKTIISNNLALFKLANENSSIVFMNQRGAQKSILGKCNDLNRIIPIPIEILRNNVQIPLNNSNLSVTCISRFVGFKMPSIMHFINTAIKMPQHNFYLIGHGFWERYIKLYIYLNKIKNISLLTDVSHNEINSYILKSDIGFAQGTSALEFASRGIPVVIAPYSSLTSFLINKKYFTLGYFGVKSDDLGDVYYSTCNASENLHDLIEDFENIVPMNTQNIESKLNFFDKEKVFSSLLQVIKDSRLNIYKIRFHRHSAPNIKLFIKYFLGLLK